MLKQQPNGYSTHSKQNSEQRKCKRKHKKINAKTQRQHAKELTEKAKHTHTHSLSLSLSLSLSKQARRASMAA
jgi:hypothetical protein